MMKTDTLIECGPLPPYVYLVSTRHHLHDKCSQAFPVFRHSSTSVYYTERKQKNKKQGEHWEQGLSVTYTKMTAQTM